jgi:anti-sigma B factor antagonist
MLHPSCGECERDRVRLPPAVTYEPPRPHVADASERRRDHPPSPDEGPPEAPSRPFAIRTETSAHQIDLLTLTGALGADGARQLVTAAEALLPDSHILILDLSRLTACDTAGVDAVIEVDARARHANVLLVIRPASGGVHRVFVDTGAAERLRIAGGGGGVPRARARR